VVPKILDCPTDTRRAATNFATLQNENLSYFVAGTPEYGNPNSVLSGNRNVAPAYGSVARVGGYRSLRWTGELHRFKGNVLFGDGHVDQLSDMFSITNSGMASIASLHMPSVQPPTQTGSGSTPNDQYSGGINPGSRGTAPAVCAVTNRVGTNLVVTWQTGVGQRKGALLLFPPGGNAGFGGTPPAPIEAASPRPMAAPMPSISPLNKPAAPDWSLENGYRKVADGGKEFIRDAALLAYEIPWYLLLILIAALLELRRRVRARHRRLAASS
jgi:prepilin-type processing-associated H-X9-DG protein